MAEIEDIEDKWETLLGLLLESQQLSEEDIDVVVNFGRLRDKGITYGQFLKALIVKDSYQTMLSGIIRNLFTTINEKQYKDLTAVNKVKKIVTYGYDMQQYDWIDIHTKEIQEEKEDWYVM